MRVASTPQCRAARAANAAPYDAVDHVMTYMFTDAGELDGFTALGLALHEGGRMPLRLPSVGHMMGRLAGMCAAPAAVAGADVIPWRPSLGVYLLIEEGRASAEPLLSVPGVAGAWWLDGAPAPEPYGGDNTGKQVTWLFLDRDPVAVAEALAPLLRERWAGGAIRGLLAAPFHQIEPFEWDRYLP
jgi:hypothetical protein